MHPEVWDNPESGGCHFRLWIDDELYLNVFLDPIHNLDERCLHFYSLDVPAGKKPAKQIAFETKSREDGSSFRWALWVNPIWSVLSNDRAT
jgi:hypothetical protein